MSYFKFPLHYDSEGQFIFDDNGVVADKFNSNVFRIRGYGKIVSRTDVQTANNIQDEFGKWAAKTLNNAYKKELQYEESTDHDK